MIARKMNNVGSLTRSIKIIFLVNKVHLLWIYFNPSNTGGCSANVHTVIFTGPTFYYQYRTNAYSKFSSNSEAKASENLENMFPWHYMYSRYISSIRPNHSVLPVVKDLTSTTKISEEASKLQENWACHPNRPSLNC